MRKKAIIYDLDNTIYSVLSIANELFAPLFKLLREEGINQEEFQAIEWDVMRKPFQYVAARHKFEPELIRKAMELFKGLKYTGDINYFADYPVIKTLPGKRFLVTMGFLDLQWSKIRGMGIEKDFEEVFIIDPGISNKTKKDIFSEIMVKYDFNPSEMLVVGDDLESEIKAARELGVDAVLYDKNNLYDRSASKYKIGDFAELALLDL